MPKNEPNASISYSQLSHTWYNLKQSIKPNISKFMLKNDKKKRKSSFSFNSPLKKFCRFIPHLTRLMSPIPPKNLV